MGGVEQMHLEGSIWIAEVHEIQLNSMQCLIMQWDMVTCILPWLCVDLFYQEHSWPTQYKYLFLHKDHAIHKYCHHFSRSSDSVLRTESLNYGPLLYDTISATYTHICFGSGLQKFTCLSDLVGRCTIHAIGTWTPLYTCNTRIFLSSAFSLTTCTYLWAVILKLLTSILSHLAYFPIYSLHFNI